MFPLPRVIAPVSVTIGGQPAEVRYAGAVPYGWVGLLMAEVVVPGGSASGDPVPVVITPLRVRTAGAGRTESAAGPLCR